MAIGGMFRSVKSVMAVAAMKLKINHSRLSKLSVSSRRRVAPLLARGASFIPMFGTKKRVSSEDDEKSRISEEYTDAFEDEDDERDGVWRKTILMGEKCKPLDFSGAIYYDSEGRQLSEYPVSRSPLRSPSPSFVFYSEVEKKEDLEN